MIPKKQSDRNKILHEICKNEKTTIIYESPHRLKKLLKELSIFCGGDREIMVARELTKRFEESIGTNLDMIIDFFEDKEVIGEITLVIGGEKNLRNLEFDKYKLEKELADLIEAGLSLSAASTNLAKKKKLPGL